MLSFSFFKSRKSRSSKSRKSRDRYTHRKLSSFRAELLEERVVFNAASIDISPLNNSSIEVLTAPAELRADPLFAPGTPPTVIASYGATDSTAEAPFAEFNFSDGSRWLRTATNTSSLTQGDATTITWSVVPDGTPVSGSNGEPSAPSNLRSFFAGIYGSNSSSSKPEDQPWFAPLKAAFDRWSALSGITFVYEPNDDGAAMGGGASGVINVRGDVRLTGHALDGNSGTLAYCFYPTVGDMVIDTSDSFYSSTGNNSLRLRNTVAHELGHALGFGHSTPTNGTKLMEPMLTLNFDGPQEDDILAANRGYGDVLEKNGGNDTTAKASPLTLASGAFSATGLSIDDDSDTDYFRITVGASSQLNVTLTPTGTTYTLDSGSFNALTQSNLALTVYGTSGTTVLATASANGAGQAEALSNVILSSAGTYYVKVTGSANAAQMYKLTGSVTTSGPPAPEITVLQGTTDISDGQTIDFGATGVGAPVSQSYTIRNDGTQTLTLAPFTANSMPAGFTLVSNIDNTSLAPGGTASFSIRFDATALGTYGGSISFGNNDSDENPFNLTLQGTVASQLTAIDAGGSAVGSYAADKLFTGGSTYSTTAAIDTSGVSNPAGQGVYQTERYGNFSYTLTGLTPAQPYTLRLHFAEIYFSAAGQRLFNVQVNGTTALSNYDVFAAAGGRNKAVAESIAATADASGKITVQFTTVRDNAKLSGLELLADSNPTPTNNAPTVATAASATPGTVTGTTTTLSVLGADANTGEASLSYRWTVVSGPGGAAIASFSANDTNSAKNATATFSKAGSYTLRATITDPSGATVTSDVNVTVAQAATSVAVAPGTATVTTNGTQQLSATVRDQFGDAISPANVTWSVDSGGPGTVSSSGLYTAPATGTGSATVRATSGGASGTSTITISAVAQQAVAIDAGGGAVGSFAADKNFVGGSTYSTGVAINTSGVSNPAGQGVYQSERYGNFTYTLPGLTPGAAYTLRLHFAEIYFGSAGQRLFNVQLNGTQVLTNYDVFAAAGGANKAVVASFSTTADAAGNVTVKFISVRDNAKLSGLELLADSATPPTNGTPTIATPAGATPGTISGTSTTLSVLGADTDTGEASLTYHWSVVSSPSGAAAPTFSTNDTNAAKNVTANFSKSGSYTFRATVTDPAGATATSDVSVTVNQTATSMTVTPGSANVASGGTQQFTASVLDQFGAALASQPSITWSVDSGGLGSVNSSGLYTAPASGSGSATVRATSGSISGAATVSVTAASQQVLSIDAGGGAVGSFAADKNFTGGSTYSTGAAINTSGVTNPAGQGVYQTERYGNFSYALSGFTPGAAYAVRLHFAEIYWSAPGQRLFNVQANGTTVLSNYDIYAAAGGINRAIVETVNVTADASGKITLNFVTVRDNAKLSGLEVLTGPASVGSSVPGPAASQLQASTAAAAKSTTVPPALINSIVENLVARPSSENIAAHDLAVELFANEWTQRRALKWAF